MAEHLTAAHARRASGHPPIWPPNLDAQYMQAAGEDLPLGLHADEHLRREGHSLESGLRRKGPSNEVEPQDTQSMLLSAFTEALLRGKWLLGLLIVQSTSSFVLDRYRDLLREHLVVTLFLTMLVGAGGNAGNQSAIKVIRALATGNIKLSWQSARRCCLQQAAVGMLLGSGMSLGGFLRVYLTSGFAVVNAAAISLSLFIIVMSSVLLGTVLPFALAMAGLDPANAGTSIQVVMDILGVAITCAVCHLVLVQLSMGLASEDGAAHVAPSVTDV